MSEPETYLALAALRYLADPSDTLAIAEIINLTSGMRQEAWLKDRLDYFANKGASREWGTTGNLISEPLVALKEQRSKVKTLSPSEALVLACSTADVRRYVSAWSKDQHEALQRIANLDILVEYAKRYEESRSSGSDIATIGGLLAWFEELTKTGQDMKAVTGGDSVSILTHHRSKGLEWPVVISIDMEKEPRANHWGINMFSSEAPQFDDPLKHRAIRYWPFPFGRQQAGIPVKEAIDTSDTGSAAMKAAIEENKRLLYVSFTRARDLLVVGLQGDKPDKRHWLNSIQADWFVSGESVLTTPNSASISSLTRTPSVGEATYLSGDQRVSFLGRNQIENRLKLRFSPSQTSTSTSPSSAPKLVEIGERIAIEGGPAIQVVGNAVHAVFAQYFNTESKPLINELVDQILSKHCLSKCIIGKEVLLAAERLEKFLTKEYGVSRFISEWPVSYQNSDGQVVSGWVDLIAESPDGLIIIDHKSFPGSKSDQERKAQSYASQLAAYRDAFGNSDSGTVRSTMIYMPMVGSIIEVGD